MTLTEWASTLAGFTAVLTFIGIVISKLLRQHTNNTINLLIKDYLSELKPNSGSSLRDDIKEIRKDVIALKVDLSTLEGKFDQHIKENV